MYFNKWTFFMSDDLLGKDFYKFLVKLVYKKTNIFLYLKVVNKPEYLLITGYSLQLHSNTDSNVLLKLIYSNIDPFLFESWKNKINVNDSNKDVIYMIFCGKWMISSKIGFSKLLNSIDLNRLMLYIYWYILIGFLIFPVIFSVFLGL